MAAMSAPPVNQREVDMTDFTRLGTISRRNVIKGAVAGAAVGALGMPALVRAQSKAELTFALWGEGVPVQVLKDITAAYNASHPDVNVTLEASPGAQYYQQLDTRIAGKNTPDIMRSDYASIGRYGKANVLMDLAGKLDADFGKDFVPTFWSAVTSGDKIYAVPANLDTEAVFYNADIFDSLSIVPPKQVDKSWTWAEFIDVAKKLDTAKKTPYAFAMQWQVSPFRWLPFLYQHGGQLLSDDLTAPMVNSKEGIETIQWLQSWFTQNLVPASTSIKSPDDPSVLFANGTLSMFIGGDWKIPAVADAIGDRFKWSVTYMPRDKNLAAGVGGSCWAVARDSKYPDQAVDFLKYLTTAEMQREFVAKSQYLPARLSQLDNIAYTTFKEERRIFIEQAQTIPAHLVATISLPQFSKINLKMGDELDLAFTAGQSAEQTAQNISDYISTAL
jgi:multiple sugar transport system substrate-binding protein